jgi:hypothetical protein
MQASGAKDIEDGLLFARPDVRLRDRDHRCDTVGLTMHRSPSISYWDSHTPQEAMPEA